MRSYLPFTVRNTCVGFAFEVNRLIFSSWFGCHLQRCCRCGGCKIHCAYLALHFRSFIPYSGILSANIQANETPRLGDEESAIQGTNRV